jgi:hypothetical protein
LKAMPVIRNKRGVGPSAFSLTTIRGSVPHFLAVVTLHIWAVPKYMRSAAGSVVSGFVLVSSS